VRIEVLLAEPRALDAFHLAVPPSRLDGSRARIRHCTSWEELVDRVREGAVEVAVVDPAFGMGRGSPRGSLLARLETLRSLLGPERIVLHVSEAGAGPHVFERISRLGFPVLLRLGVDDDPDTLRRALARAGACALLQGRESELGGRFDDAAVALVVAALSVWPPPATVRELACRLHVSPRTLRARFAEAGLPPPIRVLGVTRLLEAHVLRVLGVSSCTRIALLLGYEHPGSLSRLCRTLTGQPLGSLLDGGGATPVLGALVVGRGRRGRAS